MEREHIIYKSTPISTISLMTNPVALLVRFQVECWGVTEFAVVRGFMVMRQYQWSMERLQCFVKLGEMA